MVRHRKTPRIGLILALSLLASTPLMMGQGCMGQPANPRPANPTIAPTVTGNQPPFFEFTWPLQDISREVGDVITIHWTVHDPDSNAAITLLLDPDNNFGNGNERVIMPVAFEDTGITSFRLDTSAISPPLAPATYRIIAQVNDGVNPELLVVAPGRLLLFGSGLLPGNISPSIMVTQPTGHLGVSQGDVVDIAYCGRDPDDGEDGVVPDIILLLDFDDNPTNDLDLTGPDAAAILTDVCLGGFFPREIHNRAGVPAAIALGCFKDDDCLDPADATPFQLVIDVGLIPPRPDGSPYHVRATMWDHTNPPVHAYARGSISVTALGSGTIDLAHVGRTISGTKFQGFDAGGRTGSTTLDLGDFDGDGADDFIIVDRFGRPFELGNIGSSRLVFGLPGQKFGGQIPVNNIATTVRGTLIPMRSGGAAFSTDFTGPCPTIGGPTTIPGLNATEGIVSMARVGDVTGDGRPEILYGLPFMESVWDYIDDDPMDCPFNPESEDPPGCYNDLLPNPLSMDGNNCAPLGKDDCMRNRDWREFALCSNDLDLVRETTIDGGFAIMVGSENEFDFTVIGLNLAGQATTNDGLPCFNGARWRGGWYDQFDSSQTRYPYAVIPDNRFGQTVASMPAMNDTRLHVSPRFGTTLLISAPDAYRGRGMVTIHPGQNWTAFSGSQDQTASFPVYTPTPTECPNVARGLLYPGFSTIIGAAIGDEFGWASAAGDYNMDGSRDILCGAPGASRNGADSAGVVYVLFGRRDFAGYDLANVNAPRMEIHGTNPFDRFGQVQTIVGDVNHDGVPDIGFASPVADGPGGVDSGFIGIIFGGRPLTGENIFTVNQVGTSQLPGMKLYGSQPDGHAGTVINNAGDFNGDGTDDLLIVAPNERHTVDGIVRRGAAYILFGGTHMVNGTFHLSQVGTPELPGAVFVSPYAMGTADEAPIDWAGPAGDVNSDGFDDILIGVSTADFVNPLEPSQRRVDAGEAYLIYGNNTGTNRIR